MRKFSIVATALIALAGGVLFVARQGTVVAGATRVGRFQTVVEGSRTRLFAVSFRLDTLTGKTWKSHLLGQGAQAWIEVKERDGEAPENTSEVGTYQISAAYLSDTQGQELAAVVRVDTRTGKTWYIRAGSPHWQWATIAEGKK